ncbi:hypothetical protein chiPu_0020120 [Chiloscyllium punctatum]|uniref:Uncharacterized protein n=1 Tax=Chiloscyllium punctatum TaxID=137246 RepID=A0A401RU15_CHIPU|nr:hypothetical protein [Chiloscyllium punctatum]
MRPHDISHTRRGRRAEVKRQAASLAAPARGGTRELRQQVDGTVPSPPSLPPSCNSPNNETMRAAACTHAVSFLKTEQRHHKSENETSIRGVKPKRFEEKAICGRELREGDGSAPRPQKTFLLTEIAGAERACFCLHDAFVNLDCFKPSFNGGTCFILIHRFLPVELT